MATEIKLIPVHPTTREVLTTHLSLTLNTATAPTVYLGDNEDTEILDPALDARVVKIYSKRQKVFAYCIPDARGVVKLNGTPLIKGTRREIKAGDIVAMRSSTDDSEEGEHCYRLEQQQQPQQQSASGTPAVAAAAASSEGSSSSASSGTAAAKIETDDTGAAAASSADAAESAPSAATAPAASLAKDIGEETMCAICMEIMVEPRTVVPCGHSFCRQCLATQSECAECRGPIKDQVQCRSLQNLIEQLVTMSSNGPSVFDKEDLESYKQRTQSNSGTPAAASAAGARKRRRQMRQAARSNRSRTAPEVILCLD